jgi:hypothetical protein
MRDSTETQARRVRGIGRRKCAICGRQFKPLTERILRCGACEAKHQRWLAEHGLAR